jgi:hypothetical protein
VVGEAAQFNAGLFISMTVRAGEIFPRGAFVSPLE